MTFVFVVRMNIFCQVPAHHSLRHCEASRCSVDVQIRSVDHRRHDQELAAKTAATDRALCHFHATQMFSHALTLRQDRAFERSISMTSQIILAGLIGTIIGRYFEVK
jgi:hypothetical protein